VKLFTLSLKSQVNQFNDNASRLILLALVVTAVLQVYCLNTALKLYTSVVVVPVFYGTYTALGLVNTIIYLDEIGNYPPWAIVLVFVGISVLIYGVYLLSSKPDPSNNQDSEQQQPPAQEELPMDWTPKDEKQVKTSSSVTTLVDEGQSSAPTPKEEGGPGAVVVVPSGVLAHFLRKVRHYNSSYHKREHDTFISLHSSTSHTQS
jgi:hypothetical protein